MKLFRTFDASKFLTSVKNTEAFKINVVGNVVDLSYEHSPGVYSGRIIKCDSEKDAIYACYLIRNYLFTAKYMSITGYKSAYHIKPKRWKVDKKYLHVFTGLSELIEYIDSESDYLLSAFETTL